MNRRLDVFHLASLFISSLGTFLIGNFPTLILMTGSFFSAETLAFEHSASTVFLSFTAFFIGNAPTLILTTGSSSPSVSFLTSADFQLPDNVGTFINRRNQSC
eukprot:UN00631